MEPFAPETDVDTRKSGNLIAEGQSVLHGLPMLSIVLDLDVGIYRLKHDMFQTIKDYRLASVHRQTDHQ